MRRGCPRPARELFFQKTCTSSAEGESEEPTGKEQQREHVHTERLESGGAGVGHRQHHQHKDDIDRKPRSHHDFSQINPVFPCIFTVGSLG